MRLWQFRSADRSSIIHLEGCTQRISYKSNGAHRGTPDFSKDEPARDRSSRDKDGPQMPCLSPGRRRAQVLQVMIIAVSNHARPLSKEQSRQTAYDGPTVTLSHGSTLSHRFVSVLPRGLRRIAAAASAFLTRWRRSCSSRYSVSSERSKLVRALGFVR